MYPDPREPQYIKSRRDRRAPQSIESVAQRVLDRAKETQIQRNKEIAIQFLSQMIRNDIVKNTPDDQLVHIQPSTARKSAALGLFKYWRVYELLKHYDRLQLGGTGKFVLTDTILKAICEATNLAEATVIQIIRTKAVQGIFWNLTITKHWRDYDEIYIELIARNKVGWNLSELSAHHDVYDAERVSKRKALLRIEDFRSLQSLEAASFAAWLATCRKRQFTGRWADLYSAWGRDRRVIREWCEMAGVKIIHNIGYADHRKIGQDDYLDVSVSLSQNNSPWADGQRLKYFRANTYQAPEGALSGKRGVCRKAAAHFQRGGDALQTIRTNHEWSNHDSEKYKRISKSIQKNPTLDHYIHEHHFDRGLYSRQPANLWDLHYVGKAAVCTR